MSRAGWFTRDGAWLAEPPPHRGDLTLSQLADLLALSLEGEAPDLYGFSGPRDILSDLHLVATNEIRTLRERWERLDADTIRARRAASRVWRLVLDAHGRKTMRKDEVRAALEGGDDA